VLQLADSVPRELDQQAYGSAEEGGVIAALWKAKFHGHLSSFRLLYPTPKEWFGIAISAALSSRQAKTRSNDGHEE
jgi:hypothetical protein